MEITRTTDETWKKRAQIKRGIYFRVGGIIIHLPNFVFLKSALKNIA